MLYWCDNTHNGDAITTMLTRIYRQKVYLMGTIKVHSLIISLWLKKHTKILMWHSWKQRCMVLNFSMSATPVKLFLTLSLYFNSLHDIQFLSNRSRIQTCISESKWYEKSSLVMRHELYTSYQMWELSSRSCTTQHTHHTRRNVFQKL